jgi:predicted DNA-binding transcriptional regulator AlpA
MTKDALLNPEEAAEFLGFSATTLQQWRCKGGGPRYIKIRGRLVRYWQSDLDNWVDEFGMKSHVHLPSSPRRVRILEDA